MSAYRPALRRLAAALVLLTVGFIGGWVSATIFADSISLTRLVPAIGPGLVANQETPPSLRQQFRVFWEVWNLVEAEFYRRDKINHTRMIRGAISGMLGSLDDPYTVYQEPELASQTNEHMQGRMGGHWNLPADHRRARLPLQADQRRACRRRRSPARR
jgi:carboxyl-terminal processing protease